MELTGVLQDKLFQGCGYSCILSLFTDCGLGYAQGCLLSCCFLKQCLAISVCLNLEQSLTETRTSESIGY
jgi:hypothetical protein